MAQSRDRWGGPISVPNQAPKSTPTMSTKEGGTPTVRRSGGGGGGGSSSPQSTPTNQLQVQADLGLISTPTNQAVVQSNLVSQRQNQILALRQNQQSQQNQFNFSGRVEESFKGQPVQTQYYVAGQKVGRTFQQGGQTYAETQQPSRLTFQRGGTTEQVKFTRQGAEVQTQVASPDFGVNIQGAMNQVNFSVPGLYYKTPEQQQALREFEARQNLSAGQRLKIAYESAPGYPFSIRGGIRAGVELLGIGLDKVGITKLVKEKLPELYVPVRSTGFENFVITGAFSPTLSTTTQVERQLFEVQKVSFAGTTYTSKGGTEATVNSFYNVMKAGKNIKGYAQANSKLILQGTEGNLYTTSTKGINLNRGVVFPSGKEKLIPGQTFGASEVTGVYPQGENFIIRGFGRTNIKGKLAPFRSAGISTSTQDYVASVGLTKNKEGGLSVYFGKLFIREPPRPTYTLSGKSALKLDKSLISASLSSLKSSVSASVVIPPSAPVNFLPSLSSLNPLIKTKTISFVSASITGGVIQETKTTPTATNIFKTSTTKRITTRETSIFNSSSKTSLKTRQGEVQLLKLNEINKNIPRHNQIENQMTRQKQGLVNIQVLRMNPKQELKQIIIPSPSVRGNPRIKTPTFNMRFFGARPRIKESSVNLFVKEKGIFKFKGTFANVFKASQAGRFLTATTINRSYKISGANAPLLPGYRHSKKKGQQNVFVELSKTSLSQRGEQATIQLSKILKGGRKKRR